ncbi:MAG: YceD family protein [Novosphingobium sp.]
MSEFERIYDAQRLPAGEQQLEASEAERAALAARFGLVAVKALSAQITLIADGPTVRATGRMQADVVQSCAVSGEDLAVRIAEPIALHFVPASDTPLGDEIELEAQDLDEIEMDAARFDLGEAVAQSMALGIDPYLEGPGAAEARRKAGIVSEGEAGPFAVLKGLLKE